jgi:hypothetical protein
VLPFALALGCTPSPTPDTESPVPDEPVGPMSEVLAEGCDVRPGPALQPGDDLHRVTLADATARCNDGTPPVLYVRAASDPAHTADWVVHLDGGGLCQTAEECAARWCGATPPYDASSMSSAWTPEAAAGHGILSSGAVNAFRGWNVVRVHYCSSDLWMGTAADHVFDAEPPFRVAFQGHGIVDEVMAALRSGVTSDDGAQTLPTLSVADRLVWSGASAGAWGALLHAHRVIDSLPDTVVTVAPDAGFSPAPEVLPADRASEFEALLEQRWDEVAVAVWEAEPEPACLDAHAADPWRCIDPSVVLRERLTGPVALHHDLYDFVLYQFVAEVGGTIEEYGAWSSATLDLLRAERPAMSLHVSACGRHTVIDEDDGFFGLLVEDRELGPPARSFHQVLAATVEGERVLAVDGLDREGSRCP